MKKTLLFLGALAVLVGIHIATTQAVSIPFSQSQGSGAVAGYVLGTNGPTLPSVWVPQSGGGSSSTVIYAGNGILVNASSTNGYIIVNNGVTSFNGATGTIIFTNPGYVTSSTGLTYFFPATSTIFYPSSNPANYTGGSGASGDCTQWNGTTTLGDLGAPCTTISNYNFDYIPIMDSPSDLTGTANISGTPTALYFDGAGALNLIGAGIMYGDPVNGLTLSSQYIEGDDSGGNAYTIAPAQTQTIPGSYNYTGGLPHYDQITGNSFNMEAQGVDIQDIFSAHYNSITGGSFNMLAGQVQDNTSGDLATGAQLTLGDGQYEGQFIGGNIYLAPGSSQVDGSYGSYGTIEVQNPIGSGLLKLDASELTGSPSQYFTNDSGNISLLVAVPPTSSSACVVGDYAVSATSSYFCVSTNTWKRSSLSSF